MNNEPLGVIDRELLRHTPNRRELLRMLGLAAGSLTTWSAFGGQVTRAWPVESENAVAGWKQQLCVFTSAVLPPAWSQIARDKIAAARYSYGYDDSFSGYFSSPVRLALTINPIATRYADVTFEFDGLPYYDRMSPCRRSKDLNSVEMVRLLDPQETDYYKCVLSPCTPREPVDSRDKRIYRQTAADDYEIDPRAYVPQYARNFTDGANVYRGVGVVRARGVDDRLPLKNVFISSFDVS